VASHGDAQHFFLSSAEPIDVKSASRRLGRRLSSRLGQRRLGFPFLERLGPRDRGKTRRRCGGRAGQVLNSTAPGSDGNEFAWPRSRQAGGLFMGQGLALVREMGQGRGQEAARRPRECRFQPPAGRQPLSPAISYEILETIGTGLELVGTRLEINPGPARQPARGFCLIAGRAAAAPTFTFSPHSHASA